MQRAFWRGCAVLIFVQALSGISVAFASEADNATPESENYGTGRGNALEEIKITAQRTTAAQAREAQKEALNVIDITTFEEIKKIPDISVAEAVRRIPGISLETDEGEGRYVNCRGLDADLNSTTFDGLRLPPTNNASPFGGYRAVTLDSIPIGLVGAITVTKSNLPSQDPESLGCGIEITPKTAPQNGAPFIQGNLGTGYQNLRGNGIVDVAVTAGGRFGGPGTPKGSSVTAYSDRPFSVVLTATYYDDHRGIDDTEPAYFDDTPRGATPQPGNHPYEAISGIDFRDYSLHRKRHGYGIDLGYQPDAGNSWYMRYFDAGYTELYYRPYLHLTPDGATTLNADGSITDTLNNPGANSKNLRDERETARDRVFVLGGKNVFDDNTLDYRVGYTKGTWDKFFDENSSYTYTAPAGSNLTYTYSPTGPGHTPNQTVAGANYLDPTQYQLTSAFNSTAVNYDKELSFVANFDMPVKWVGGDVEDLKVGTSARLRKKRLTALNYSYPDIPPATPLLLSTVASGGPETYYNNTYPIGVDIAPGYLQSHFGPGVMAPAPSATQLSPDLINSLRQFLDAKEDVYAAYVQYEFARGPFGLVGGVRVERTQDTFNSYNYTRIPAVTDTNGNEITPASDTLTPVTAKSSYTNAFPSLQGKYEIQPDLITRATWSTNLARPGFNQSTVSEQIDYGTLQITVGNPNLKPATANAFDLTIEKYLPNSGIISLGLFDKEFKDYIVPNQSNFQTVPGVATPLRVVTFSNTPKSHARGIEFNVDYRFKELPGILGGLGAGGNYTFVDTDFQIRPGENSTLPSASKNTWNATIFYEQYGITLRLVGYSTSADLFSIGPQRSADVFNNTRTSMDFGSSYAFTEHLTAYFNAKNLLNTPHAFYQGTVDRPIQREFYDQTFLLGVRFDY